MATALLEPVAETPVQTPVTEMAEPATGMIKMDPHPLVPIFIFGAISLAGAFLTVGTILAWLALRNTGICAPF